jgi:hypothetical protein
MRFSVATGLLILAGKVVFADRPPDAVEGFERLAVGVQGLADAEAANGQR